MFRIGLVVMASPTKCRQQNRISSVDLLLAWRQSGDLAAQQVSVLPAHPVNLRRKAPAVKTHLRGQLIVVNVFRIAQQEAERTVEVLRLPAFANSPRNFANTCSNNEWAQRSSKRRSGVTSSTATGEYQASTCVGSMERSREISACPPPRFCAWARSR
jgi:hypothetical protein